MYQPFNDFFGPKYHVEWQSHDRVYFICCAYQFYFQVKNPHKKNELRKYIQSTIKVVHIYDLLRSRSWIIKLCLISVRTW